MEDFACDDGYIRCVTPARPFPFVSTGLWHLLFENCNKHDVMCHITTVREWIFQTLEWIFQTDIVIDLLRNSLASKSLSVAPLTSKGIKSSKPDQSY